ncbi:MAG: acetylglutamate kinase [Phycisphaerales bacterium]|nr:acetylglutamate kinase [Phycisphaerales bacterium]
MSRVRPKAVLKFGGEIVADTPRLASAMREVRELTDRGWRFVLCHGGNPQANALTARLGLEKKQVGGRRITDAPTLQVMKQVLAGECNVDVVAAAAGQGLRAVGISGVSAGLVTARRRPPKIMSGCGPDPIDFGFVGDITNIDTRLIEHLWDGSYTPVLNTLGISEQPGPSGVCEVYNINADTVSSAVAAALRVNHLFLMTGVPGVLRDKDDPFTRIPRLTEAEARRAIAEGVIVGGMIPKVEEALANLASGIGAVHVVGAEPGTLTGEANMPGSVGTVLLSD